MKKFLRLYFSDTDTEHLSKYAKLTIDQTLWVMDEYTPETLPANRMIYMHVNDW
jgi:hypothetical protein